MSTLAKKLNQPPHSLTTTVLSIDDLYLPHHLQCELAARHPNNPLVQHRGQPSTHDLPLALSVLSDLHQGNVTRIPSYDKSAFNGQGDRVPQEQWKAVNQKGQPQTKVIILEGWCIGFRALPEIELRRRWEMTVNQEQRGEYQGRLGQNKLENVTFVNEALRNYQELTNQLDAFIHIDAADPMFAYQWRLEQEVSLRLSKGSGMTDEQVIDFVNGYYPAYELFTDRLRAGVFDGEKNKQLRIIIGEDRKVIEVLRI